MLNTRASGILCHPTSLPGPYGIGDLGGAARTWVSWLANAGMKLWQVLPLGPTGYADSPYQSFSAFGGNHMLISPEDLIEVELLPPDALDPIPNFPEEYVAFGEVITWKEELFGRAAKSFIHSHPLRDEYEHFCSQETLWLDDYALFMALKKRFGGKPWTLWEKGLASRNLKALDRAREELSDSVDNHKLRQFIFNRQWGAVRRLANENGVRVIGDIPIFVAHDSADVWAHPELFLLDEEGMPTAIAGVPPDYFAATGQRWGNPLYRWDEMKEDGYQWWLDRFRAMFNLVDIVRIDHFRGIDAHWEIPADSLTAEIGRWVSGPGEEFLDAMHKGLGSLPLIAEDLGFITESVKQLRDRYDFPGMKIFQFGLEGGHDESFLPHAYPQNCVAYTGTHDNDTSRGWYEGTSEEIQDRARRYISSDGEHFAWDLIRALWASQAWTTVAPLQDFLELPTEARMNYPGTVEGNWKWRVLEDQLTDELAGRVRELNENYGR